MKFEHFLIALLVPMGLLLIAGGAAFQHFQYWAVAQVQASTRPSPPVLNSVTNATLKTVSNRPLINEKQVAPKPDLSVTNELQPVYVQAVERTVKAAPMPAMLNAEVYEKPMETPAAKAQVPPPGLVVAQQPILIAYDNEIIVEFPKALASEQNIKRALSRVLLSPNPFDETDLLSVAPLDYKNRPALYRKVLNNQNEPIRYPRAAFRYADYLIANHQTEVEDDEGRFIRVQIPLKPSNLAEPARQFEPWVLEFADHFNVPPALVFAVMETESAFNPRAVSRSNAKGLMQIKPNAAGRDVYQYIDFKIGAPGDDELFDAQKNIRLGTAYLSLLKHDYLAEIRNPDVREMVAISSYNGGMSTVFRVFGDNPAEAIEKINKLNPRQVYRKLRYEHASDETRRYLDKVLQAKTRYQALLGEDAKVMASR